MELITLQTKNTTYQMGVNEMGFLLCLTFTMILSGSISAVENIKTPRDLC